MTTHLILEYMHCNLQEVRQIIKDIKQKSFFFFESLALYNWGWEEGFPSLYCLTSVTPYLGKFSLQDTGIWMADHSTIS